MRVDLGRFVRAQAHLDGIGNDLGRILVFVRIVDAEADFGLGVHANEAVLGHVLEIAVPTLFRTCLGIPVRRGSRTRRRLQELAEARVRNIALGERRAGKARDIDAVAQADVEIRRGELPAGRNLVAHIEGVGDAGLKCGDFACHQVSDLRVRFGFLYRDGVECQTGGVVGVGDVHAGEHDGDERGRGQKSSNEALCYPHACLLKTAGPRKVRKKTCQGIRNGPPTTPIFKLF